MINYHPMNMKMNQKGSMNYVFNSLSTKQLLVKLLAYFDISWKYKSYSLVT